MPGPSLANSPAKIRRARGEAQAADESIYPLGRAARSTSRCLVSLDVVVNYAG